MRFPISCLLLLVLVAPAFGQPSEPHSHGSAVVRIALSGTDVMIAVEIPGADLVGFEHPPTQPEQQNKIDDAMGVLEDWSRLVAVSEGNCVQQTGEVNTHGFEAGDTLGHAHFQVEYALACTVAPTKIEMALFASFPGLEQADVEIVGPSLAIDKVLTPSNPIVSW